MEDQTPSMPQHPVLLTNTAELEDIRKRLKNPEVASIYTSVVNLARSEPEDVTSPQAAAADVDPRLFTVGWFLLGMESVLPAAGVVWRLTGDRTHLDHAIRIMDMAMAWEQWSDGRHLVVDGYYNAAPETASGMRAFAWALDLFDDQIPEPKRRAYQKRLAYLAQRLTEISLEGETRWAANVFDDWSADIHSAIGQTALILLGTDERAENWLQRAIERIVAYLESIPADGGHPSGISRWEFALTHCCFFLEALYRVTGQDLRKHPAIERTRRFAIKCLAPGGNDIIQIDQGLPLHVSSVTRAPLSKLLAKWFEDPVIGWAIFNTCKDTFVEVQDLLWYDDSIPQNPPEDTCKGSVAFPDIGWAVMRSGWNEDDNMISFQCTPYWPGYHHLDQGTFEIFIKGREVVLDSGLGWRAHPNYFDRYRDSLAHNVILIDGRGQLKHTSESHGAMKAIEMSDNADYALGDCSRAYESVRQYHRSLLFLKPDVVVIRDVVSLERPAAIEWLMHGHGNFQVHFHADDKGFNLNSNNASIQGFVLSPQRWKHNLRRGYKLADWQTRHEVTHPVLVLLPEKSSELDLIVVMKLGGSGLERRFPGFVNSDGTLTLEAGGLNWTVGPGAEGLEYCCDQQGSIS